MHISEFCRVIAVNNCGDNGRDITVRSNLIAPKAAVGQFLHIRCGNFTLRRPISICDIGQDTLRFVFEVRGEGTKVLAETKVGDTLDIVGPCGSGFYNIDTSLKAALIGGGIGTPPLLPLAKMYGKNATAILGFRSEKQLILKEDYEAAGADVIITTDDGSVGRKAFTTQVLEELVKEGKIEVIYACGPTPMLKGVQKIALENNIPCQLSLEERMACGVGACLACATAVKDETKEEGFRYAHVCKYGPVIDAKEAIL